MKDRYIKALINEINIRNMFFNEDDIKSIYIGGGTPSLLEVRDLHIILNEIFKNFKLKNLLEFTIELNPDDVNKEYINELKSLGVNRISLGIQTFNEKILKVINRRHDRKTALNALDIIFNAGFQNLSVDLIYGMPFQKIVDIETDLKLVLRYPIKHISYYSLIIEEDTYLKYLLDNKKITLPDEDLTIKQYELILEILKSYGFIHYEISNFAFNGYFSIHNVGYWKLEKYLGLGPSAHSFDGDYRYMNISNVKEYIEKIFKKRKFYNSELLTLKNKFNEYLLTGLRTIWGVSLKKIELDFNDYLEEFKKSIEKYLNNYVLIIDNDILVLTEKGFMISDKIISDCFIL